MLADGEGAASSNGASRGYANGSGGGAQQQQRVGSAAVTAAANGTHKLASMNGSSSMHADNAVAPPPPTYFGHDREEVTRILIQALSDMGYQSQAEAVSRASGFELESPTVAAFRSAVLTGAWPDAERLLAGAITADDEDEQEGNGLVLAPGSDRNLMLFWMREQKYLELLELRDQSRALMVLRQDLTPLFHDTPKLHFLSSLLMCQSTDDLKTKAEWDGAQGQSRKILLSELSKCISPSVMLPENRLAVLLQQVKQGQIDTCLYHTSATSPSLYADHYCDRRHFPREVAMELNDLAGEVWQVQFSHDGRRLAGCGIKDHVIIWEVGTFTVVQGLGGHDQGVTNVTWSPDDSLIITCSVDKCARLWNANNGTLIKQLERFEEPVSGAVWAPDGRSFTTGSLDKLKGLRTWSIDGDLLHDWGKKHRVQDICGSPDGRWIVAVDDLNKIHVYNALSRELEYEVELKARPTSVAISEDSQHLLVNRRDGEAQLIDLPSRNVVQKFLGHTGGEYLIRADFGGANESFVVSGSEDGNILIWHKNSGAAVERLPGHTPRCNAVAWNPADPCMLASCGDDGTVKIWSNPMRNVAIRERYEAAARRSSNGWRNGGNDGAGES